MWFVVANFDTRVAIETTLEIDANVVVNTTVDISY